MNICVKVTVNILIYSIGIFFSPIFPFLGHIPYADPGSSFHEFQNSSRAEHTPSKEEKKWKYVLQRVIPSQLCTWIRSAQPTLMEVFSSFSARNSQQYPHSKQTWTVPTQPCIYFPAELTNSWYFKVENRSVNCEVRVKFWLKITEILCDTSKVI